MGERLPFEDTAGSDWSRAWDDLVEVSPSTPQEAARLASPLVHAAKGNAQRLERAREHLAELAARLDPEGETPAGRQVWRVLAAIHSFQVDTDAFSRALANAVSGEKRTEEVLATVLATVATLRAQRGRLSDSAQSLDRVVRLAGSHPPPHLAAAMTAELDYLAGSLLAQSEHGELGLGVMLRASAMARTFAGVTNEPDAIRQAEERMAECHLSAGQPRTALLHAEAALAVVDMHGGPDCDRIAAWAIAIACLDVLERPVAAEELRHKLQRTLENIPEDSRPPIVAMLAASK